MSRSTSIFEYFAFDGPLHVAVLLLVGAMVAALFVWSLHREQHVIGKRNAVLFGVLRFLALGAVIWMLLAPSTIRSEKSTTRKSIAVMVDVSPSMMTVDPPAGADDVRWAVATDNSSRTSLLATADRALAAAIRAERSIEEAARAIRDQQNEQSALEAAALAHDAVERTKASTGALSSALLNANQADVSEIKTGIAAVVGILEGPGFERLATLVKGFRRGNDSFQSGWRESLADLSHHISGIRRRLAEISQSIAANDEIIARETQSAQRNPTDQAPRLERVAALMRAMDKSTFGAVRKNAELEFAAFDESVTSVPSPQEFQSTEKIGNQPDPKAPAEPVSTNISAALEELGQAKRERPLAAVFMFTDAAHNDATGADPRTAAEVLAGTPLYVVPIGNTQHSRDVDLRAISAPGVVMKDDEVVVEVTLQAFQCEGESLKVELLRDGEVLQVRETMIDSDLATPRLRFNTQLEELGVQRFQVRALSLDGESSEENNFDQFEVNVTRDRVTLLLADELPRWEFRYLAQLFRRDAKVECDELLFHPRSVATGKRAESKAFPVTADEWDHYDVVLLGDVSTQNLSVASQESLGEYVRQRGGTLVVVAGNEFMPTAYSNQPIQDLLPVTKSEKASGNESQDGYALEVTDEGSRHHALMIADTDDATRIAWEFINRNSPLHWLSEFRQAKPTARTLIAARSRFGGDTQADASESAFLCWHAIGRGRVVYLASPETYRLRFLRGDRLHYRFWGQMIRWAIATDLAGGNELVSIRTDRADYRFGDSVSVEVRLKDDTGKGSEDARVEATAIGMDDKSTSIPLQADPADPGRYVGNIERLPTGIYRIEPGGSEVERLLSVEAERGRPDAVTASFTVRAPVNRELLDTRSDRALAQQIAQVTGGQIVPPTAIDEVLALTNLEPIVTERTEKLPMWVQWKFLWLVFGCLFVEWSVRKWMGVF